MRTALAAALLAAALGGPATASCSLGQLGTNPFQCGPQVPEDERDAHTAVSCVNVRGVVTAAAYVPYAIEVTIACHVGGVVVEERREGPAGALAATVGADDWPRCTTVSWWYADYSQGSATYGC